MKDFEYEGIRIQRLGKDRVAIHLDGKTLTLSEPAFYFVASKFVEHLELEGVTRRTLMGQDTVALSKWCFACNDHHEKAKWPHPST